MIFRQLFDYESWTYTYLIGDEKSREAVLIDPVYEQVERDLKLIRELELDLKYLLETHVHADHITSVSRIRDWVPQVKSVASFAGGVPCVDIKVHDGDEIKIGDLVIKVIFTPGHTDGCLSYYLPGMVFTGDTIFIRGCGRTDFQGGDPANLYDSVTKKLFTLPDDTIVYPAHDYKGMFCSTIGEEKKFNPRLAGKTKEEFCEIMNNLNLSSPKKIKESIPANHNCGKVV